MDTADTICLIGPPLIVYLNVYGAVPFAPLKVITGCAASLHTVFSPAMEAVSKGLIVKLVESAFGQTPLNFVATVGGSYFFHTNTNSQCNHSLDDG